MIPGSPRGQMVLEHAARSPGFELPLVGIEHCRQSLSAPCYEEQEIHPETASPIIRTFSFSMLTLNSRRATHLQCTSGFAASAEKSI